MKKADHPATQAVVAAIEEFAANHKF
jgi:hypothetical protein